MCLNQAVSLPRGGKRLITLTLSNSSPVSSARTEEETLARLCLQPALWLGRDSQPGRLKKGNKWKQMETVGDGKELSSWVVMLGIGIITFFLGEQSQNKRINTCSCFRCTVESWPRLGKARRFVFPQEGELDWSHTITFIWRMCLGNLERSLINSILWWLSWMRAGCKCHLGDVLLMVFIILNLWWFLKETYLWIGRGITGLASVADTVACCEPRWQPAEATGYDGRWFAACLRYQDLLCSFSNTRSECR